MSGYRSLSHWLFVAIAVVAIGTLACEDEAGDTVTLSRSAVESPTATASPPLTAATAEPSPTATALPPSAGATSEPSPYSASYTIMNDQYRTQVTVTVEGGTRSIVSNGLPNHETGDFPNLNNPNSISAQSYSFMLPANPELARQPTAYNVPQPFGIAYNGVLLDPFAAEWYQNDRNSGWQLAALANPLGFDEHNAHVQPSGAYHYHGGPTALLTVDDRPELIGFAGDGFPIYGPYGYEDPSDPGSTVIALTSSFQLKAGQRSGGPGGVYDGTYVGGLRIR